MRFRSITRLATALVLATGLAGIIPALPILFLPAKVSAEPAGGSGEQRLLDVREFKGLVRAARAADISPRFDGLIQSINFTAGDLVRKGDLLVQLLTLEQEYGLKLDKAAMAQAAAELELAEAELRRARELRDRDVNSPAALEVAVAQRDVAAARLDGARTKVEMTEIIISEFSLYAPFDGIISEPAVNVGAYITKDAREESRLATVTQLDPIHVVTEVPYDVFVSRMSELGTEEEIAKRVVLTLILPDGTEYPHKGKLISGGFAFNETTQEIASLGEFPNPDRLLRPGLLVRIRSGLTAEHR